MTHLDLLLSTQVGGSHIQKVIPSRGIWIYYYQSVFEKSSKASSGI